MDSRTETDLHGVNAGFLTMLIEMARIDSDPPFEVVRRFGSHLLELNDAARQRISDRPFLLLAFRLDDAGWWQGVLTEESSLTEQNWTSRYPRAAAIQVARSALVLAWRQATLQSFPAALNAGASPEVVKILETMELETLRCVADGHLTAMQPRWDGNPTFWPRLLAAATKGDPIEMDFVDRLAAKLLATDLLRKR